MAMLNCSYDRLLVKVLYGFVSAVFLPFCFSAVNNCPPCGPGEFCKNFFGMCVTCKDYCPGDADCPSECPPIEPNFTTIASTTTEPTSTQSDTTSAVVVLQSTNANTPSDGGDITFLDNGKDDSELPAWLAVGMLGTLGIIVLFFFLIFFCRKHCKTLKMPRMCCFSSGDSENRTNIELDERPQSDGGRIKETEWTVQTNPMANQPPGCHQTTVEYTAVPVDDEDSHVIINLQRPSSQPDSSRPSRLPMPNVEAPADPPHSASDPRNDTSSASTTPGPTSIQIHDTSPSTSGVSAVVVQSASIHPTQNPPMESEKHQRACPSDQRFSPRRTPDTHRRITDGTHEGHAFSIGASPFNPPNGMCEDIRRKRHSGDGD